jgi:hypothetical protein
MMVLFARSDFKIKFHEIYVRYIAMYLVDIKTNYCGFSTYDYVIHRKIVVFLGFLVCHSLYAEAQVL